MGFGNFSSVELPTDQGIFNIRVLPELIMLGAKNGQDVYTFLEHYVMVPIGLRPLGQALAFVHRTDVFEDLFLPSIRQELNAPQRLLSLLDRTGNGILLYFDSLRPDAIGSLQKGLDSTVKYEPASMESVIRRFAGHPNISCQLTTVVTRDSEKPIPPRFGSIAIHRLDEVVDVPMPQPVRSLLFPDADESIVLRKCLSHFALVNGIPQNDDPPFVRVHSSCATGDINASRRCDCGPQFRKAMRRMTQECGSAVVLDDAEGRGVETLAGKMAFYRAALGEKLDTYAAMRRFGYPTGADGYGPDLRQFAGPAQLLQKIGITSIILGTNNRHKAERLEARGIRIAGTDRVVADVVHPETEGYLKAKRDRGGHVLGALKVA